jgi:hypothetical protein
MVCTPTYSFSAPEGEYLEPTTSLHTTKAEGYEIHPKHILGQRVEFCWRFG